MTKLAAIPIDTFVFIVLVLIASFFRWITKQADAAKRSGESTPSVPRKNISPREETDSERVRRFLEALGQPTSSAPPPPVEKSAKKSLERRVVIPKGRTIFAPLPPLTTTPPEPPRRVTLPREITRPPYEQKTFKPIAAEPLFEIHESAAIAPPPPPPIQTPAEAYVIATQAKGTPKQIETDIVSLLRSPSGLRDAVLLREIFGPPRSLQSLEF